MKKNLRVFVYLMIVIVAAGGVYLWSQNGSGEEILDGLAPDSYDVEATCIGVDGNNLICNAGNDTYLFLDGTKVYLRNYDVEITENGDEETKVSYKEFSFDKLKKEIEKKKEVPVYLWLTQNGKVKAVMAGRESYENNNASLVNLEGLDPNTSTATMVILDMDKNGMKVAPAGYTAEEADKFRDLITTYKFAKSVKFYTGTVTVTVDEDGSRSRNFHYEKDYYKNVNTESRIGQGIPAHVWLNQYGNVYAVLVHEEKIVLK